MDILNFEAFLSTQDNLSNNEREIIQVEETNEDLNVGKKSEMEADQC